jgi:hypothetical protein
LWSDWSKNDGRPAGKNSLQLLTTSEITKIGTSNNGGRKHGTFVQSGCTGGHVEKIDKIIISDKDVNMHNTPMISFGSRSQTGYFPLNWTASNTTHNAAGRFCWKFQQLLQSVHPYGAPETFPLEQQVKGLVDVLQVNFVRYELIQL